MTDILLIQPPIRDFYLTRKRTLPYGLACIAAALKAEGFSVELFDGLATSKSRLVDLPPEMSYLNAYYGQPDRSPFALFHHHRHFGYRFEHIGKKARESGAFLVGVASNFTAYSDEAIQTAETVKSFHPACKLVIGGHHATAMPAEVMKCRAVDFVLRGEGEVSMPLLAQTLRGRAHLDRIPGIVFRNKGGQLHTNPPAVMEDLDRYPLPAIELMKHSHYRRNRRKSTVIVASRGCPMKCSYCSMGASSGPRYRRRGVGSVLREIEKTVNGHDGGFIDFEDENLSLDREWFLRLLHDLKKRFGESELELRAMNGLFPPALDEAMIKAMKEAGFKTLNLSLGSTSAAQLKRFRRPDVRRAFENALRLARKYNLEAVGYMIAGAPGQRAEESVADLLYLARQRVLAGVSIFYPAPGSQDFELCTDLGILPKHLSLMRSAALPISHTTSRLESVTLLRLGRILNFTKSLLDQGAAIPAPLPFKKIATASLYDRRDLGKQLLQGFLHDGRLRGMTPDGQVYAHRVAANLTTQFIQGLKTITVRGTR